MYVELCFIYIFNPTTCAVIIRLMNEKIFKPYAKCRAMQQQSIN